MSMNCPIAKREKEAWQVYNRVAKLDVTAALRLGASKGQFDRVPCLRFDAAAHDEFLGWRSDLETRLRTGGLPPALEGHLAKYRKLVPALGRCHRSRGEDGRWGIDPHSSDAR